MVAAGHTAAAERQRRYRDRRRQGVRCMRGDVPADVVVGLAERGWLDVGETKDPLRLGDVLVKVARRWLHGQS